MGRIYFSLVAIGEVINGTADCASDGTAQGTDSGAHSAEYCDGGTCFELGH